MFCVVSFTTVSFVALVVDSHRYLSSDQLCRFLLNISIFLLLFCCSRKYRTFCVLFCFHICLFILVRCFVFHICIVGYLRCFVFTSGGGGDDDDDVSAVVIVVVFALILVR